MEPKRTTETQQLNTYRPHSNELSRKVPPSDVIEIGLPDYELIYCSRKTSLLKLNEHYEISFRSFKKFLRQNF